jgi:hypothetical protein
MILALDIEAPTVGIVSTNRRKVRTLAESHGRSDRGIGHGVPCPNCGIL